LEKGNEWEDENTERDDERREKRRGVVGERVWSGFWIRMHCQIPFVDFVSLLLVFLLDFHACPYTIATDGYPPISPCDLNVDLSVPENEVEMAPDRIDIDSHSIASVLEWDHKKWRIPALGLWK